MTLPLLEGLWEDGPGEAVGRGGALACHVPGARWVWVEPHPSPTRLGAVMGLSLMRTCGHVA